MIVHQKKLLSWKTVFARFEWGLIVDITPPDYETRMAILQKKIEEENLDIPPEAFELHRQPNSIKYS